MGSQTGKKKIGYCVLSVLRLFRVDNWIFENALPIFR